MKTLFILLTFILSTLTFAQSTQRPKTPYWNLVAELERAGFNAFARYDWSQRSLNKMLYEVATLSNFESQIGRRKVVYKMGGENPGKSGFTTLLKNGDIYVQVYYSKPLKNIDVALTLGHELIHALHIDSGLHDAWKRDARSNHKTYSECVSENAAYTWSAIYAANKSTRDWINTQMEHYQDCMKRYSK